MKADTTPKTAVNTSFVRPSFPNHPQPAEKAPAGSQSHPLCKIPLEGQNLKIYGAKAKIMWSHRPLMGMHPQ